MAFAHYLIITSSTAMGLQDQFDKLGTRFEAPELVFNPNKCATFRLEMDRKNKN